MRGGRGRAQTRDRGRWRAEQSPRGRTFALCRANQQRVAQTEGPPSCRPYTRASARDAPLALDLIAATDRPRAPRRASPQAGGRRICDARRRAPGAAPEAELAAVLVAAHARAGPATASSSGTPDTCGASLGRGRRFSWGVRQSHEIARVDHRRGVKVSLARGDGALPAGAPDAEDAPPAELRPAPAAADRADVRATQAHGSSP